MRFASSLYMQVDNGSAGYFKTGGIMSNKFLAATWQRRRFSIFAKCNFWLLSGTVCMSATAAAMENTAQPEQITIYAPVKRASLINTDQTNPATMYQAGKTGIDLFGGAGNANPYTVLAEMPSVSLDSVDPYGVVNMPGGNKGLRVRGEMMPHGGIGTVDGIPLSGIDPGPGHQWLFDMENISAVTLSEGPVAPDKLSFFTNTGVPDSRLLWPAAQQHFQLSQSLGSFDFRRTFMRLDSGKLSNGATLLLSASDTAAKKWRGPGNSLDGRTNFEVALDQPVGDRSDLKFYVAYNDMKGSNYRPLTYAQAGNLGMYNNYDYASTSVASPLQAVNYYGYNRQNFRDWSAFSEFNYRFGENSSIVLKPFYMNEQGSYLDGMATGKVREWLVNHDWYGITAEYQGKIADTGVKAGYWWESLDPPGPPSAWKLYNPTAAGNLNFASWSLLGKTVSRHEFSSFYALADKQFGGLDLQAGARYLTEKLPGIDMYNTAGVGDVSYEQALAASSGVIAKRSASGPVLHELLPYMALGYDLAAGARFKLSAGRNFGAPSFDVWPVYQTNAALQAKYTAQQIWDNLKPEIADAIDMGVRFNYPDGYLEPTVFYSSSRNKGVSFVDPAVGVAYPQNAGKTHAYGLQVAGGLTVQRNVDMFASFTYDRAVFDQNFTTMGGAALAVQGLQLPDTPRLLASLGATCHKGEFSISPVLRYTGKRYGDALQTEPVPGYATVDLSLGYQSKQSFGKVNATLSVVNLFDRRYIGFINASYLQNAGQTSYYPGAPRSLVARLSIDL